MRGIDLIAAFEIEINKIDDVAEKPITDDSIYWLNQAVHKFIKDRFNGNLPKRTSYEQNEKRTRDLINLYKEWSISSKLFLQRVMVDRFVTYDKYKFVNPTDMLYTLTETVTISDNNDENKLETSVFECTADNWMYRINNSLTDFHYKHHRARPLRVRTSDGFYLITDKNYKISSYTMGYIRTPEEITSWNPDKEYNDFSDHIWPEIIKIAALMYIENQSDPRYKTITNEVLTQE